MCKTDSTICRSCDKVTRSSSLLCAMFCPNKVVCATYIDECDRCKRARENHERDMDRRRVQEAAYEAMTRALNDYHARR